MNKLAMKIIALFFMFFIFNMNLVAAYPISGSFTDISGTDISYSSYEGKYVLLEAFATGCSYCWEHHPNVEEVYNEYRSNVTVLSITGHSQDDLDKIKDYVETYPTTWTIGLDYDLSQKVSYSGTPTTFLLDPNGVVLEKWVGVTSKATMGNAIEYYVNQNPDATDPDQYTDTENPGGGSTNSASVLGNLLASPIVRMVGIITLVAIVYVKSTGGKS